MMGTADHPDEASADSVGSPPRAVPRLKLSTVTNSGSPVSEYLRLNRAADGGGTPESKRIAEAEFRDRFRRKSPVSILTGQVAITSEG